jgi:hypothetical protein
MAVSRGAIRDLLLPGLYEIVGKYPEIPRQWPTVFARRNSKMAREAATEMRYTGLAQIKPEGSATVFDNASGERFVYNADMQALGLGFAQTRESIADNLYKDQFGPHLMGLSESFAQTWEILHANIFNQGTVFNPSVVGDFQPLFSTQHPIDTGVYANRPSPDLDFNEASLEYAVMQIRAFPDQAGLLRFFRARRVVVPRPLEFVAERIFNTDKRPGTSDNDTNALMSSKAVPDGYQVMDFLTSPFAWFVLSTVMGLVSFDREPYDADMQVDPNSGNLLVFAYERKGISWNNPRAAYGSYPTQ